MIEDSELVRDEQLSLTENAESAARIDPLQKEMPTADAVKQQIHILLSRITNERDLEKALKKLQYTTDSVKILRESLPEESEQRTRVLNCAAEIILNRWKNDLGKAGTMATLLSQTWDQWKPTEVVTQKLVELCERAIEKKDVSRVAIVQPLAYTLGAKGRLEFYGKWLKTTTMEAPWREADLERNMLYYAHAGPHPRENQLAAIERHLNDPKRTGLLRAHDIGLLYQIRVDQLSEFHEAHDPEVRRTNNLLRQTVDVLEAHKQDDLVAYIRQHRTI